MTKDLSNTMTNTIWYELTGKGKKYGYNAYMKKIKMFRDFSYCCDPISARKTGRDW